MAPTACPRSGASGTKTSGRKSSTNLRMTHTAKMARKKERMSRAASRCHITGILQQQCGSSAGVHSFNRSNCIIEMLGLFFEKGDRAVFAGLGAFLRVTNNLDSHYYVLERAKDADQLYVQTHYFAAPHPQLLEYYTAWREKEMVLQEEPQLPKKPKEKKGIGGLLSKKSKIETGGKGAKEAKEEVVPLAVEEEALYVQLQSFSEVTVPAQFEEAREFMALIYLLAMRVFQKFSCWPHMVPVVTESRRYKFVKKGSTLEQELARLFDFVFREEKMMALDRWSPETANALLQMPEEERREVLGAFLKKELQSILEGDFTLKLKKGQEYQQVTVSIEDASTLVVKETGVQVAIEEYEVSYYHHDAETRQIIMEHNIDPPLLLEGKRTNLLIKYLKQFVIA